MPGTVNDDLSPCPAPDGDPESWQSAAPAVFVHLEFLHKTQNFTCSDTDTQS